MLAVAAFCVLALCVPISQGNEFKDNTDEIRGEAFIKRNVKVPHFTQLN